MFQETVSILHSAQVAENVYTLEFVSERIAHATLPGQFLNLKPDDSFDPLLRRAYSVHRIREDRIEVIFNVVGKGSRILAAKEPGDPLDVMGPLGVPFHYEGEYGTAILVSGGVGIAPMPILGDRLLALGKSVVNIHGARTAGMIANDGRLTNPIFATDDGSLGFHGNVVGALDAWLHDHGASNVRLFACGPNRMLGALGEYCNARGLPLEVSLECQMACGIGICQGCPVEMATGNRKYTLVCTHGPNYDINDIVLDSIPSVH
ncbi:MAG: dihydroorotate dehydrogenase electron transfer subunit [Bacteroidetes bacterium]|nr:dihydroorotate dehydrogenase electron transfer subunit [Bacteroidota bacterium]